MPPAALLEHGYIVTTRPRLHRARRTERARAHHRTARSRFERERGSDDRRDHKHGLDRDARRHPRVHGARGLTADPLHPQAHGRERESAPGLRPLRGHGAPRAALPGHLPRTCGAPGARSRGAPRGRVLRPHHGAGRRARPRDHVRASLLTARAGSTARLRHRPRRKPRTIAMRIAPVTASEASVTLESWSRRKRTIAAPSRLPQRVPVPPRTTMRTTVPEVVQWRRSSDAKPCPIA